MGTYAYPKTRREDVSDVIFDVRVEDPYRWLEEDTEEVMAWEAEQVALTDAIMNEWPDRDKLRQAIRTALTTGASEAAELPHFHGAFTFYMGEKPGGQQPVLWVTEGADAAPRILVDPNVMAEGSALDWFHPSPQGAYVAYGISQHGDEQSGLGI